MVGQWDECAGYIPRQSLACHSGQRWDRDTPEVRSGSSAFPRPISRGIEGPKMSRSNTPIRAPGLCIASANARLTTLPRSAVWYSNDIERRTSSRTFPDSALARSNGEDAPRIGNIAFHRRTCSAREGWSWVGLSARKTLCAARSYVGCQQETATITNEGIFMAKEAGRRECAPRGRLDGREHDAADAFPGDATCT
jgi:hypothetical protein